MHAIISGAGIAGSTLAYFLAQAGHHVTIVEKSRSLLPHGQNVDLQGSAISVLGKMGLMNEVRRCNTTEKGTQFIASNGNPFAPFPVKEGTNASPTSQFEILRADLAAILYDATKDHPNVEYMFETTIKNVISNDEQYVKVELSNKDIRTFNILVAADGQWSKLRQRYFPSEDIQLVDMNMYGAYWTVPRLPEDNDLWNIYFALGSRLIAIRPDPHGTTRAMMTFMPCNDHQRARWQEASRDGKQAQQKLLHQHFKNAGWQAGRLLNAMTSAPDFHFHKTQQVRMRKWSNGRIVCLGDAAYAPTPLTGMGTSLAITGAYVLAGELCALTDGHNPCQAFEAFEHQYRPFVEESQKIPSFVPAIAHPETAWKRALIHACLSMLSVAISFAVQSPWLAKKMNDSDDDFALPHYMAFEAKA